MQSERQFDPEGVIASISAKMLRELDTGAMARLRRLDIEGPGIADFWELMHRCGTLDLASNPRMTARWMTLVKVMATLAGTGAPGTRGILHENSKRRRFGTTLCDGGRMDWPSMDQRGEPRPFVSEKRLARFLARTFERRAHDLLGFARMIAAQRARDVPVNCLDIYWLLFSGTAGPLREVASSYYQRLDRASSQSEEAAA